MLPHRLAWLALPVLLGCGESRSKAPGAAPGSAQPAAAAERRAGEADPRPPAPAGATDSWSTSTRSFAGKLRGGPAFTLELPASIEQDPPPTDHRFTLADSGGAVVATLEVGSMIAYAQHRQAFADYKARYLQDVTIVREAPGDESWGVVFLDPATPDVATALFATPTGDSQSRCMWDVPRASLRGDQLANWDRMERSCRSIAFSW